MLEAWPAVLRRVPDASYWIVGDGNDRQRLETRTCEFPVDPSEVAEALVELLTEPTRARQMGDVRRKWAKQEFSFNRFSERLRDGLQA
jgi:glycosyltransferase involved in cell wall biosynthesis